MDDQTPSQLIANTIAKTAIEMTAQIAADIFSEEIDMLDVLERVALADKVEARAKEHWNKHFDKA